TYLKQGRYELASADFDAAIKLSPNDPIALNDRCYTEAIIGRLVEAFADCNRSLEIAADGWYTLDSRGYAYLRSGDYARAIADYDAAIKLSSVRSSGLAPSYYGRAVAYWRLGDHDRAEQDFRQALALDAGIEAKMSKLGVTR